MQNVIEIQNLTKNYHTEAGEVVVLKGIDITIQRGEFVANMR